MGSRLHTSEGSTLYQFWNNSLAKSLEIDLTSHRSKTLINLASQEYFKAVDSKNNQFKVVTPKFFENRNGDHKLISFYAKKGRGLMARFIINNNIIEPDSIKDFNLEGYKFDKSKSDNKNFIFARKS